MFVAAAIFDQNSEVQVNHGTTRRNERYAVKNNRSRIWVQYFQKQSLRVS